MLLWVTLSGRIQTEGFLLPVRNKFVCFPSCPLPFQEQRGIDIKYIIITPCSFGGVRSLCVCVHDETVFNDGTMGLLVQKVKWDLRNWVYCI